MKKILSLIIIALFTTMASAQFTKTVNVTTAGTLSTLASAYQSTVTNLTVTGNIDARDIKTMRDDMPLLEVLDISVASIQSYTGSAGTKTYSTTYPANAMPQESFCNWSKYTGKTTLKSIALPANITSIGSKAFYGCTGITEFIVAETNLNFSTLNGVLFDKNQTVLIQCPQGKQGAYIVPNTVTTIGKSAFFKCKGISSIALPNGLTSIGDGGGEAEGAFYGCTGITGALTLPPGLTSIGMDAFSGCTGITGTLTFPTGLTSLGANAFRNCTGITSIILPPALTTIIKSTFKDCTGLISLTLPAALTSIYEIQEGAIYGCSALTEIIVPEGNLGLSSLNGVVFNKSKTSIIRYPEGKQGAYIVPNTVTSIGDGAFFDCTGITTITLPANITTIGNNAFSGCSGITEFFVPEDNINFSTLNGVLFNKNKTEIIQCPAGKLGAYFVPNTVTSIGNHAFSYCSGITSLTLPAGLTSIGSYTFYKCTGITSLTLPSGLTSIGNYSFYECSGITSLTLPAGLTSIGSSAFYDCTSIASLTLPAGLTSIGSGAFSGCLGITSLTLPAGLTSIGSGAFWGCSGINSLTLPVGLASIESYAFRACPNIKIITSLNPIPPTLGTDTFMGVSPAIVFVPASAVGNYKNVASWSSFTIAGEKRVTINNPTAGSLATTLTAAGYSPLSSITHLTVTGNLNSVDISEMKTNMTVLTEIDISGTNLAGNAIPVNAFQSKTTLTTVIFPTTTTSIGDYAFDGCTGITGSLTLPVSLNNLGVSAFGNCTGITEFVVPEANVNFSTSNEVLFNKNKTILIQALNRIKGTYTVPNSVISIGAAAFQNCTGITSLILPSALTNIGSYAFSGCTGITNLTFPTGLTSIGSYAFSGCAGITNLTLPAGLTSIGEYAFSKCTGIKNVISLPTNLTSIGSYAFQSCSGIAIINSLNLVPPTLGTSTFIGVTPSKVCVPLSSVTAYKTATGWSAFNIIYEKRVTINNLTAGGLAGALITAGYGPLASLTHLTITGNLNSVDITQMKNNMTMLTEIDFSGVALAGNTLPANAFQNKATLTGISLPATIISIGDNAFSGCTNLAGVLTLPASLSSIGNYAYQNCISLSGRLNIPFGVKTIGSYAFDGCNGLIGDITIPNSVTSIDSYAYQNCIGFTGILSLPNAITSIGTSAFSGCKGLTGTLTLPNTITSIGSSVFQNCSDFTGLLTLPNGITTIPNSSFSGCTGLSGILTIPTAVTSIENSAFSGCNKLTELNISENTTSISDNAFLNCVGLTKISVPRTSPPTIFANTFGGILVEKCTLVIPIGSSFTYQTADYWSVFILLSEKKFDTAISNPTLNSNVKVYTTSSEIIIEGSSKGEQIVLYTVTGLQLQSFRSVGERISIPAKSGCAYLVKTKERTFKVLM